MELAGGGNTNNNISIGNNNSIASDPAFGGNNNNILLGNNIGVQGSQNVGIGFSALNAQDGQLDIAVGYEALAQPTGSSNQSVALGAYAGYQGGPASESTFLGYRSGVNVVSATASNVIGENAATSATLTNSEAIGALAGDGAVLSNSQLLGFEAGLGSQLSSSQAIGNQAGVLSSGSLDVYVGNFAGSGVNGNSNTLIGAQLAQGASRSVSDAVSLGDQTTPANLGVVVGVLASESQAQSVVVGFNASSTGSNSVVLGAGSTDAGQANVVSVGTASAQRKIVNVGAGSITSTSTDAVNGSQLFTINQAATAVGNSVTTLQGDALLYNPTLSAYDASNGGVNQRISNVAAGTALTDAVDVGQLDAVAATAGNAVQYDNVGQNSVTLGGVGSTTPVTLTNVAAGSVTSSSLDAVNGSQLYATNQTVSGLSTNLTGVANSVAGLQSTTLQRSSNGYDASYAGTAQQIHNLAAGTSTADAVNVGQLDAVVATAGNAVQYDNVGQNIVTLGGAVATTPVTVTNLAPGSLSSASTDAVNGAQLYATNQGVQGNTQSIAGLSSSVSSFGQSLTTLQGSALQFNGSAYDASQSGIAQRITNVAAGTGPTDAVNLAQLNAASANPGMSVQYDSAAQASVTLGGVGSTTPVAVTNVASGRLTASSTDAVNGSQLYATNQAVAANTTSISGLESSYAGLSGGAIGWNTTLNAWDASHGSVSPQRISNVAAGTATTDAVDVGQLDTAIAQSSGGGGNTNLASMASAMGGGASYSGGVFVPPSYTIQGAKFANVGGALSAVDANLTMLNGDVATLQSSSLGTASTTTTTTTTSPTTGGTQPVVTQAITLGGSEASAPVQLRNVATGQSSTDAVNVQQVDVAVKAAENYADTVSTTAVTNANNYTNSVASNLSDQFNQQFTQLNRKVAQQCAMGSAMTSMVGAAAGATDDGRVAAGAGICSGGAGALAVGYATPVGERVHLDMGAAFSGGQGSIGVGVGWDVP